MLLAILLSNCQSSSNKFPSVVETFVSPVTLSRPRPHYGFDYILSRDGKSIWLPSIEKVDLVTGKIDDTLINDIRSNYKGEKNVQSLNGFFGWSADERFLATTGQDVDIQNDVINRFIYLVDTQTKSVTKLSSLQSFSQWSPVNSDIIFASSDQGYVWNRVNSTPVSQWEPIDFTKSLDLSGNGEWLWENKLNLPVAYIDFRQTTDENGQGRGGNELGIASYDPPNKYTYWNSVMSLKSSQKWWGAIFDPTGKYILSGVVEPDTSTTQSDTANAEITDTVFLLIDWRTKEKTELFRLSSFDSQHVVANDIAWSGDGSTILVWRKDTSPIVLKIKYP